MSHGHSHTPPPTSNSNFNIQIDEFYDQYTCIDAVRDQWEHRKTKDRVQVAFETDDYMIVKSL